MKFILWVYVKTIEVYKFDCHTQEEFVSVIWGKVAHLSFGLVLVETDSSESTTWIRTFWRFLETPKPGCFRKETLSKFCKEVFGNWENAGRWKENIGSREKKRVKRIIHQHANIRRRLNHLILLFSYFW